MAQGQRWFARLAGIIVLMTAGAIALFPGTASATSASTRLNLNGGDQLEANTWHCGSYWTVCAWQNSAKLWGYNPAYATWIKNQSQLQVHGIGVSISLGSSWNVSITSSSQTLINTQWTNWNDWISDSGGEVVVSAFSTYVSTRETASSYHPTYGTPRWPV